MSYDIIIKNGLYFDGSDAPGSLRHVGIKDGRIDTLSVSPLDEGGCPDVIDASGRWVTPASWKSTRTTTPKPSPPRR